MNFFKQMSDIGIKDVTIEIKVAEDGRMTVLTSPKSIAKDKALNSIKPLLLTGTVEELDSGYFEAIEKPLKKTSKFFNNVESYEAKIEDAKKETAEAEAEKSKEKNAQTTLTSITAKLKTPADWLKNKDAITKAIQNLFEANPESAAAKKAKKDLDLNLAKEQMGGGLFAENTIEESVEEIPTVEIEETVEDEIIEEEETEEE